ncbi:MAG: prolyl oligopeptidase family serine peptidase [Muribaculaceae bacterium]|nr:prolyl oligopeptidase family serine peptidase [Muribaculaceae bacterium]
MKKTHIAICAAVGLAGLSMHAYRLTEFKRAPQVPVNIPAMPDSTERENPFKLESMLDSRQWHDAMSLGWTTVTTDSAGNMRLVTPDDLHTLDTYSTRIKSEGYAKGKLRLSATGRASVKLDGKTIITKATSDSTATPSEAQIELLPERTYDVTVNALSAPSDKSAPEFSIEFIPDEAYKDVEFGSGADLKKRVTPYTTMLGERVNGVRISDRGKYLITYSYEVLSAKETLRRAVLSETATGKVLSEQIPDNAMWLPGENAFVNSRKRGEVYDFYKTEIPSMRVSLLARNVPVADVTFSPGGKYLLYYKPVEAVKQTGPMHRYTTPDDRIPGNRDRSYLMRYDLETQVVTPITYGGPSTYIASITSDGKKALLSTSRNTPDRFPFYNTTLIEMNLNTLKCDTLIRNMEASFVDATYSPDGRQLFIVAGPSAFDGIGANYAPEPIANDFDGQGYIYDIATGKAKAVTKDFNPAIKNASVWNAKDGKIYFLAEAGFFKNIYSLDPKSGKITQLDTKTPTVRSFSIGDNDSEWLAYCGGSFTTDGQGWVLNLRNGKSRLVADPLAEELADVEFGEMQPWGFTASDGSFIDGWMCLPPEFDSSKKYPLIVYYYGGTSPSNASFYHLYSPQVFASRGYVVYVLNPSGTTGYGQEFSARHVNAWGKRTADEIIRGTKEFCKAHSFVNDKKIGCIGASYGGFMTQYLQTLTDIYAAAVSHAGISDVTSYWGEGYWGYSYNSVAAAGSYPWNNPELFTKQGSLFNADKIHTPLLLLHGTVDTNVPIGESIQLFNALKILGREVEFVTVQDENHVISGFDNKPIWQNTIMAFFAKYLKDDPKWWESLYGSEN